MSGSASMPAARATGWPVLGVLASFPIACFCIALVTDVAYARTADMLWADFSAWLLAVGAVAGVLAGIAWCVSLIAARGARERGSAPTLAIGGLLVLVLAAFDNMVHSRDAWTSVVPFGLALSAVIVVVMLLTAGLSSAAVRRRRRTLEVRS